ncbi:hypothetical protein T484DRAFT_1809671, partial [Baffinella frigidus]
MSLFVRLRANTEEAADALDVDNGQGPESLEGWDDWAMVPDLGPYKNPASFPEAAVVRPVVKIAPIVPALDMSKIHEVKSKDDEEQVEKVEEGSVRRPNPFKGIPRKAWCPFMTEPGKLQTVKYDESLLVVLDAARFLPDNVALTQATISIVDDKGRLVSREATAMDVCHADSGTHSPVFSLSAFIDVVDVPPRSWVVIRFDALDVYTSFPVIVGYAVHPLFRTETNDLYSEYEGLDFDRRMAEYFQWVDAGDTMAAQDGAWGLQGTHAAADNAKIHIEAPEIHMQLG